MLVRLAAGLALLLVLWWAFRLSMGLRWSKVQRERLREEEAGRGRIVAELPLPEGMAFFVEDAAGFRWGGEAIARGAVCGARLLLNSAVVASVERPGAALPAPPEPEDEPGRERWDVMAYLDGGAACTVRCGSVREGISRQAARAVFDALRAACGAAPGEGAGMKSHTVHLTMNVAARMDFVNITAQVEKVVAESGVREGLCLVNAMHITASVFINDDEPGLHEDYKRWLEWLAPFDPSPAKYHHNRTGEDNGDAHHKRQVMGREVVVAITRGALDFGPWEQIFYGEFDGRRPKRILVKVIGE